MTKTRQGTQPTSESLSNISWPWVAITIVILAVLLLSVPLDQVAEALVWIGVWPTVFAVAVAITDGILADSDRLRRLCRHLGLHLTLRDAAALAIPATALGIVAPFQAADVLKARQLNVLYGRPFGEALGIVATDRGFNVAVHVALLAGGLAGLWFGSGTLYSLLALALGVAASGVGLLVLARAVATWDRVANHRRLGAFVGPFRDLRPGFVTAMFGYALAADLAVASTLMVMATSAGLGVPFAAVLVLRNGSLLFGKIPITVGGYGLREGSLALGLSAFGEAPAAVAVALWFGVCTSLVPSLVALTFRPFVARTVERLREDLTNGLREISARIRTSDGHGSAPGTSDDVNRAH